jgi:hypothetical protein
VVWSADHHGIDVFATQDLLIIFRGKRPGASDLPSVGQMLIPHIADCRHAHTWYLGQCFHQCLCPSAGPDDAQLNGLVGGIAQAAGDEPASYRGAQRFQQVSAIVQIHLDLNPAVRRTVRLSV